jgi:hypothetical protein
MPEGRILTRQRKAPMRVAAFTFLVLAFSACAGVQRREVARPAARAGSSTPGLPHGPIHRDSLCVVVDGELVNVAVTITPAGDTLVSGREYHAAHPVVAPQYAGATDWYAERAPITFRARRYAREQLPLHIAASELRRLGEYRGTPVFVSTTEGEPPEALFLPVQPGCIFQMFVPRGPL